MIFYREKLKIIVTQVLFSGKILEQNSIKIEALSRFKFFWYPRIFQWSIKRERADPACSDKMITYEFIDMHDVR